ncbi:Transcription repressor [Arachis hypogaea]|uniref:Transcription repressor n=1 Tax=Arachis hypogaea TaxID=3818 RepID=A0A6B9VFR6_ARAHY|nr:Transcription repressor [Arachis hypogaea]
MRKKALMKLPLSLFKTKEEPPQRRKHHHHHNVLPWQNLFPSCGGNYPNTLSFRGGDGGDFFKTVNSVFLDPAATTIEASMTETPSAESWFSSESASAVSLSTESEEYDGESLEMVVRGVKRSERLLFEAGETKTSSILEMAKASSSLPFKESVVVAMESEDPYSDFRRSMEEMVECHGVKDDWEGLEELLCWYLKVNVC